MRVAFGFINLVQCFMVLQGYKGLGWGQQISLCDVLVDVLEGSLEKDVKYLGIMVRYISFSFLAPPVDSHTPPGNSEWSSFVVCLKKSTCTSPTSPSRRKLKLRLHPCS